ncbi:hypothetical protein HZ326_13926 [Fusarium oxysporum f. sp. albedinis]|nr:hypothetical protein HZ326_13926 [Fusarium oxysporum f. sp. albedinis]
MSLMMAASLTTDEHFRITRDINSYQDIGVPSLYLPLGIVNDEYWCSSGKMFPSFITAIMPWLALMIPIQPVVPMKLSTLLMIGPPLGVWLIVSARWRTLMLCLS